MTKLRWLFCLLLATIISLPALANENGTLRERLRQRFENGEANTTQDQNQNRPRGIMARRQANGDSDEFSMQDRRNAQVNVPGLQTAKNVRYGNGELQTFDVYYKQGLSNAPVIFMVHGGGWRMGDKEHNNVYVNKVNYWVPQGFVVMSVNYPMVPEADPYQQALEVAKALAVAQKQAARWGADANRFILMGHSAGAHIVSLLSSNPKLATAQGARLWPGTVSLDGAGLNIVEMMENRHMRLYDEAFGTDKALWERASPFHQLTAEARPILLACSSRRAISCDQSRSFTTKAGSLGVTMQVLPEDKSHGDMNFYVGLPGDYTQKIDSYIKSLLN